MKNELSAAFDVAIALTTLTILLFTLAFAWADHEDWFKLAMETLVLIEFNRYVYYLRDRNE